jgi:hypothetical protein
VTVATGVDLGQMSAAELRALNIPQGLTDRLVPYAGLTGNNAINYLRHNPLQLNQDEANALDQTMRRRIHDALVRNYNQAAQRAFTDLPREAQTVIADVAYQYGANLGAPDRTPNFWNQVTQGRWDDAVANLRNFGDDFGSRRTAEANLLQRAIDRGALPGTRTP